MEHNPDGGQPSRGGPTEDQGTGARPGQDGLAGDGTAARGHDEVSWPSPGHRALTVSVVAPISFTYHLPA